MYLPSDAVGNLFEQCAAVCGADSRIAFTYVGLRENGRPDAGPWSWLVLWLLKISGEPWIWSIRPEDLDAFLIQHHWKGAQKSPLTPDRHGVEFFGLAVK